MNPMSTGHTRTVQLDASPSTRTWGAKRRRGRSLPTLRATLVLGTVSLMLLMPVSYRAGTETAHPHAFFQGMLDMISGEPHEHADQHATFADVQPVLASAPGTSQATPSPFMAADIPLSAGLRITTAGHQAEIPVSFAADLETAARMSVNSDTPQLSNLKPGLEQGTAISSIGMLLLILLMAGEGRKLWFAQAHLTGRRLSLEPPPPRVSFCF